MVNPVKQGNYTTIFADGSVILENPWIVFPDGHGKWYWNEDARGEIVAWIDIPEGGYKYHKKYALPDWELRDLAIAANKYEILEKFDDPLNNKRLNEFLIDQGFISFEQMVDEEIKDYWCGYEIS